MMKPLNFLIGDDPILGDQQQYKYMTVDDMKSLGDDSMRMDVTSDEKSDYRNSMGKEIFFETFNVWIFKYVYYRFASKL